jgi:hypothetical protein
MMTAYRVVWFAGCTVVVLVGASAALILSPAAFAFMFLAFAAVGVVVRLCLISDRQARSLRQQVRLVGDGAVMAGATGCAFVGYAVLLGAGVFVLALCVLGTSPHVLVTYTRWLNAGPTPPSAQLDSVMRSLAYASPEYLGLPPPTELGDLTDEELCHAWRTSYIALQRQTRPSRVLALARERQRYLDELEQRNASGFASWLASGARPPGNPLPYILGERLDHIRINWDELIRGQDW